MDKHETAIVEADALELLPTLVQHYGQPFADSSAIPTYHVSRMARRHVKMVLSGDGGDESFAGYNSYEYVYAGHGRAPSATPAQGKQRWFRELASLPTVAFAAAWSTVGLDRVYDTKGKRPITSAQARRQLWNPPHRDLVSDGDDPVRLLDSTARRWSRGCSI